MAKGSEIIVSANPRGRFFEGIVTGTPKPGTVMQITAATEPVGGRFNYSVYAPGTDGEQRPIIVLDYDRLRGKLATDAYATADRIFLYMPLPGDEMNMLVSNISGTSDSFAIGDVLMVNTGDGELIATTGSPESEPFIVLETMAALTADALVWCMFTGY